MKATATKRADAKPQNFKAILDQIAAFRDIPKSNCITMPVNVTLSFDAWLMVAEIANVRGVTIEEVVNGAVSGDALCDMASSCRNERDGGKQ